MFGIFQPKLKSMRTGGAADQLIAEYGLILESNKSGVEDVSALPASKAALKAAMMEALRDPTKSKFKPPLRGAYKALSTYQPLSEAERIAASILAKPRPPAGTEEERATAFAFVQVAEAFSALQSRVEAERLELAAELRQAGVA